jgi:hypothetical protein
MYVYILVSVTVASDTFLASRHFADCVPTKYVLCRLEKIGSIVQSVKDLFMCCLYVHVSACVA